MADQVLRMPQSDLADSPDETKSTGPRLSRYPSGTPARNLPAAPRIVQEVLHSRGEPLDQATRKYMEPRFGRDFGNVRLHTDGKAAESAAAVGALAYTVGSDVVLGDRSKPDRRILAHELAHTVQQGPAPVDAASGAGATSVTIASSSSRPILSRVCAERSCPPVEFPIGAFGVIWQEAENCLQERYEADHHGHTIGYNGSWTGLKPKTAHEKATIEFFRRHFTGKGFKPKQSSTFPEDELDREGSRQRQAEPDIIDFTDQVILEITTPNGVAYRAKKIIWEVTEATQLMNESQIGSPVHWQPGFWTPKPCYAMPGGAGKVFYRAWNQGGVLTYLPVADITQEAFALALAAAAKRLTRLGPPSGVRDAPLHGDPVFDALIVTALVAIAIVALPEELALAAVAGLVRLGAAILSLLSGGLTFAFGAGCGSGSDSGSTHDSGAGNGAPGAESASKTGTGAGSGEPAAQSGASGTTERRGPGTQGGSVSADESVSKLMQIISHMVDKNGDPVSPEDAERILALGVDLLQQLQAADPHDPTATKLKDVTAGMLPMVKGALKRVKQGKGTHGGGKLTPTEPTIGGDAPKQGKVVTRPKPGATSGNSQEPKVEGGKPDSQHREGGAKGTAPAGAGKGAISAELVPASIGATSKGFQVFQFKVAAFDPTVSRKKGDPVSLVLTGSIHGQQFRATVTAAFDRQEGNQELGGALVTYLSLPSDLVIKGTDRFISQEIRLITKSNGK